MAGQAHHFRQYAPEKVAYAIDRYTNECNRLYGVMNKRLADRDFLAGDYSIADMAAIGWVRPYKNQGQDLEDFPNLKRWFEAILARPAVERGIEVGEEHRQQPRRGQGSAEGAVRRSGRGRCRRVGLASGQLLSCNVRCSTAATRSGFRRSARRARSPSS